MKRLFCARLQAVAPGGGLNPLAIDISPAAGNHMRIIELIVGADNYAAGRTVSVVYGQMGLVGSAVAWATLMSESIDNVVRVVIPRGAATGAPDTTYHRDTYPGFLLGTSPGSLALEGIEIAVASAAAAETLTVEIKAILGDFSAVPTIATNATATWTAYGATIYKEVRLLAED